jgi:hypothetical protein
MMNLTLMALRLSSLSLSPLFSRQESLAIRNARFARFASPVVFGWHDRVDIGKTVFHLGLSAAISLSSVSRDMSICEDTPDGTFSLDDSMFIKISLPCVEGNISSIIGVNGPNLKVTLKDIIIAECGPVTSESAPIALQSCASFDITSVCVAQCNFTMAASIYAATTGKGGIYWHSARAVSANGIEAACVYVEAKSLDFSYVNISDVIIENGAILKFEKIHFEDDFDCKRICMKSGAAQACVVMHCGGGFPTINSRMSFMDIFLCEVKYCLDVWKDPQFVNCFFSGVGIAAEGSFVLISTSLTLVTFQRCTFSSELPDNLGEKVVLSDCQENIADLEPRSFEGLNVSYCPGVGSASDVPSFFASFSTEEIISCAISGVGIIICGWNMGWNMILKESKEKKEGEMDEQSGGERDHAGEQNSVIGQDEVRYADDEESSYLVTCVC